MVSDEAEHLTNHATIIELAAKDRIPTIYAFREFVRVGGLMAYSIDQADMYRHLANMIRFLEVPIQEISRFTNRPNTS